MFAREVCLGSEGGSTRAWRSLEGGLGWMIGLCVERVECENGWISFFSWFLCDDGCVARLWLDTQP